MTCYIINMYMVFFSLGNKGEKILWLKTKMEKNWVVG